MPFYVASNLSSAASCYFCCGGVQDLVAENAAGQKELAALKQDGSRTRDRILMRNFIKDDPSDRPDGAGTGLSLRDGEHDRGTQV